MPIRSRAPATYVAAFTSRLQEIGFYRELSDAYVTQTVTPRYVIDIHGTTSGGEG